MIDTPEHGGFLQTAPELYGPQLIGFFDRTLLANSG